MITLNLLPLIKKQELRLRGLYLAIKNLVFTILLLAIFSAIALLITKAVLQNHFNETVADNTLTLQFDQIFNNDIRMFNKQLTAVDTIQRDYIRWSAFFSALAQLVPSNVTLSSVSVIETGGSRTVSLTGLAATREALLAFQSKLAQF